MKNITLNIIGQRVLADVLKENENIIKMNIFFFENLNNYLNNTENHLLGDIIITSYSNFKSIEQADPKITNIIFFSPCTNSVCLVLMC